MTTALKLRNILDVLIKHGEGDKLVQSDHDIVYLSPAPEDAPFAAELTAAGAHYSQQDGWYVYV